MTDERKTQKQINSLSKVFSASGEFFKRIFLDIGSDFWKLWKVLIKNMVHGTWSQKIATLIIIGLTLVPATLQYKGFFNDLYIWNYNKTHHTDILEDIAKNGESSVQIFFETYNRKYSIDCEWVRTVNVDEGMYLKFGTEKKEGSGCMTTEKWQILPLQINAIQYSPSHQMEKVTGKSLIVVSDAGAIDKIHETEFSLWRKTEWKDRNLWKFNPFGENTDYFKK